MTGNADIAGCISYKPLFRRRVTSTTTTMTTTTVCAHSVSQTVRVGYEPKIRNKDTKRYAAFRVTVNTKEQVLWVTKILSRIMEICIRHTKQQREEKDSTAAVPGSR